MCAWSAIAGRYHSIAQGLVGFETKFLALWRKCATGDTFVAELFANPAGGEALEAHRRATMARIFADSVGFAGARWYAAFSASRRSRILNRSRIQRSGLRTGFTIRLAYCDEKPAIATHHEQPCPILRAQPS